LIRITLQQDWITNVFGKPASQAASQPLTAFAQEIGFPEFIRTVSICVGLDCFAYPSSAFR